jgi:hypothetical protein
MGHNWVLSSILLLSWTGSGLWSFSEFLLGLFNTIFFLTYHLVAVQVVPWSGFILLAQPWNHYSLGLTHSSYWHWHLELRLGTRYAHCYKASVTCLFRSTKLGIIYIYLCFYPSAHMSNTIHSCHWRQHNNPCLIVAYLLSLLWQLLLTARNHSYYPQYAHPFF